MDLTKGRVTVDFATGTVRFEDGERDETYPTSDPRAFDLASAAWLRAGWDAKHVYTFSWFGRPIIQLPDDMVRMQEAIYAVRPDVIVETGIAHGGSLVYYASLFEAMGSGRVIGIDIEIREHNRAALEAHPLRRRIETIVGSSVAPEIVADVRGRIGPTERVMVILDSNHTYDHVLAELEAYAPMVSPGSYIVATDGIMRDLDGAPRSQPGWATDNPFHAGQTFLAAHPEFELAQPAWPFDESVGLTQNVTYWPGSWLKRLA